MSTSSTTIGSALGLLLLFAFLGLLYLDGRFAQVWPLAWKIAAGLTALVVAGWLGQRRL